MGLNAVGEHAKDAIFGNHISLSISADSKEEAQGGFYGCGKARNHAA